MKILDVITAPGLTGFYFDDQGAIKQDAEEDGFAYLGPTRTPGFKAIRQKGESLSILLRLEDGQVAWGDCAAVQYSGAGGRDPLFLARDFRPLVEGPLRDLLIGRELHSFRELTGSINTQQIGGRPLHLALQYGLSQALLDAVARARRKLMVEILVDEYDLPRPREGVPVFAQTGDDRYMNVDKMIIKEVEVIPHGLINNVRKKLGSRGEKLLEYIRWIKSRIEKIGGENYRPVLHFDVYGTIGIAFAGNLEAMRDYLLQVEEAAAPLQVRIEGPMDPGSKREQIEQLARLRRLLDDSGSSLELVADEWCNTLQDIRDFVQAGAGHMIQIKTPDLGGIENTVEAVLYCREQGAGAYQGGTCNETDRSARVCVHAALAARPQQMLAKPGMGVDEGLMIVRNEMNRTLALLKGGKGSG